MWWSPDGSKIAYYRFDESKVPDYYLGLNQTKLHTTLDVEAFPQPGVPNPVVDLFVYDVATKTTTQIDVRDGKPFDNTVVGHYVYHVRWSSGRSRAHLQPHQSPAEHSRVRGLRSGHRQVPRRRPRRMASGWVANIPEMRYLADGKRFIWESERNGFKNYYLYDLSGQAARAAHQQSVRRRIDRARRREVGPAVLHGARRRQPHEAAAAPRRASTARTTAG